MHYYQNKNFKIKDLNKTLNVFYLFKVFYYNLFSCKNTIIVDKKTHHLVIFKISNINVTLNNHQIINSCVHFLK